MSYLEGYGVREARKEKHLRNGLILLLIALIAVVVVYFGLRDRQEKRLVQTFVADLRSQDYKGAYVLWGCTDSKPCPGYSMQSFLEDWGPSSPQAKMDGAELKTARHCETGALQTLAFPDGHDVHLWVDRRSKTIGFAPWQVDRKTVSGEFRSSLRIMLRNLLGDCSDLR